MDLATRQAAAIFFKNQFIKCWSAYVDPKAASADSSSLGNLISHNDATYLLENLLQLYIHEPSHSLR
jgi:hypothetical protein